MLLSISTLSTAIMGSSPSHWEQAVSPLRHRLGHSLQPQAWTATSLGPHSVFAVSSLPRGHHSRCVTSQTAITCGRALLPATPACTLPAPPCSQWEPHRGWVWAEGQATATIALAAPLHVSLFHESCRARTGHDAGPGRCWRGQGLRCLCNVGLS